MRMPAARCVDCPALDAPVVGCEPATASEGARLVVVGEAPGMRECEQGRPFVGRSGQMLMRGLGTLGVQRSQVHWTNAMQCL
ncbi:MAG: uracil-DNA glycosylase, partial [Gammaproteobacteria bacterium]|nr:uracil-DNA glycosylase [Gammaproteobacteria bacterium]NIR81705.1 uracil-DNA glycosylase [Gammaproteobacteria bacterium]NIU02808.1 uracil-DNA glycosylase [Gammaproteobacteria bacterium]NIV50332.1 uracil-DNA glycosylase [Gammaproteobacteria bacterium]NIX84083.1 uracil-DNA glycosylase [Gammaproteobacteria bacterium]